MGSDLADQVTKGTEVCPLLTLTQLACSGEISCHAMTTLTLWEGPCDANLGPAVMALRVHRLGSGPSSPVLNS